MWTVHDLDMNGKKEWEYKYLSLLLCVQIFKWNERNRTCRDEDDKIQLLKWLKLNLVEIINVEINKLRDKKLV